MLDALSLLVQCAVKAHREDVVEEALALLADPRFASDRSPEVRLRRAEALERGGRQEPAAEVFLELARDPRTAANKAGLMLFDAAIELEKAHLDERASVLRLELERRLPGSRLAALAAYREADYREELGELARAATKRESGARARDQSMSQAAMALESAARLRMQLSDRTAARRDVLEYEKTFGKTSSTRQILSDLKRELAALDASAGQKNRTQHTGNGPPATKEAASRSDSVK